MFCWTNFLEQPAGCRFQRNLAAKKKIKQDPLEILEILSNRPENETQVFIWGGEKIHIRLSLDIQFTNLRESL